MHYRLYFALFIIEIFTMLNNLFEAKNLPYITLGEFLKSRKS